MTKKKKSNKKRIPKTKSDLIIQMRCNEIAMKNARQFMAGEVSIEDLLKKVYGIKPTEEIKDLE